MCLYIITCSGTGSILHSGFDPQAEYRFFLVIRERVLFLREKNVFPEDQDRFEAEVLKRGAHVINHISVFRRGVRIRRRLQGYRI